MPVRKSVKNRNQKGEIGYTYASFAEINFERARLYFLR